MPTERKVQEVAQLKEKLESAQGLVFTEFVGLTANEMVALRRELRQNDLEYRVVKNRLARIAAKEAGVEIDPFLQGPTGICFGYDDPALPFKLANRLAKKYGKYKLVGGFFEGKPVEADEIDALANLPTHEEALARLAATLQAPVQKLASALAGTGRNLAVVLREVSKQK